ncbi:MAG: type II toxin-antitoxin system HicA family toxin [Chloroflexota bacterium]
MSRDDKLLEKLRNNPKNVRFEDLQKLLESFGFVLKRSSGSHHSFVGTINSEKVLLVVPYRRPLKAIYVKKALKLIERIENAEDGSDDDENA